MLPPRWLFRYTIVSYLLVFAVLLAACSPLANQSKPVLLVETETSDVYVEPSSVKVFGDDISAKIYFNYKEPSPDGVTSGVLDATFTVPKRLLYLDTVMDYYGQRNLYRQDHEATGYYFVEPGTKSDKIMHALVSYCQSRGRSVNMEPISFLKQGFQFLEHTDDNVMHFFDPASVKLADGVLEFTLLDFYYRSDLYNIHSATVDTSQHRRRVSPGKRHDGTGRMIGDVDGREWAEYDTDGYSGRVVDKILRYHHGQDHQAAK